MSPGWGWEVCGTSAGVCLLYYIHENVGEQVCHSTYPRPDAAMGMRWEGAGRCKTRSGRKT